VRRYIFLMITFALTLSNIAVAKEKDDKGTSFYRALGFGVHVARTGDFASTEYLLFRGGTELNPLMQRRDVRVAATALSPFVFNWTSEIVRKNGHPKIALWMRIGFVVANGYLVQHNLRLAFQ